MLLLELVQTSAFSAPAVLQGAAAQAAAPSVSIWLEYPYLKTFLPIPIIVAIAPVIWLLFRDTWRALDIEAQCYRGELLAKGGYDLRPAAMLVLAALCLTLQEYYGGRGTYETVIRPWLSRLQASLHTSRIDITKYDELYSYAWWSFCRVAGYVLLPFPIYKLMFKKDRLLDMGLRIRGFKRHLWLYGACLLVVLPTMWIVSLQPDFGAYYPFYRNSSRSYFDLLLWELIYFAQFFALELFFRGLWLGAMRRSLGSGAIFCMAVPYCMIHYGKPYLEANGAIVAGIVLGSLAMRTRSIYAGFLVHITVALGMDVLALWNRHALPHQLWAP